MVDIRQLKACRSKSYSKLPWQPAQFGQEKRMGGREKPPGADSADCIVGITYKVSDMYTLVDS